MDMTSTASSNRRVRLCDIIINEARSRFAFTKHQSAALLVMPEDFYIFNKSFPEKHLEATVDLKKCKLKTELDVLYSRKDL
jgi:hypothetical protein